jgi:energy-coupling factor transporter transmembrane protein EcfT
LATFFVCFLLISKAYYAAFMTPIILCVIIYILVKSIEIKHIFRSIYLIIFVLFTLFALFHNPVIYNYEGKNKKEQIEEYKQKEIQSDSFNNFTSNSQQEKRVRFQDQQQHFQQQQQQQHFQQKQQTPPNKFSPQYAAYINAKPRAQASAKIRLGGVFN